MPASRHSSNRKCAPRTCMGIAQGASAGWSTASGSTAAGVPNTGHCRCAWLGERCGALPPVVPVVLYASAEEAVARVPTLREVAFASEWILARSALLLTLLANTTAKARRSARKSAAVVSRSLKRA